MVDFWKDKKVMILGASGFLGRHLCKLMAYKPLSWCTPSSADYDLRYSEAVHDLFSDFRERDIIINLAANVGGIGYNQNHPYALFYDNAMISLNLIQRAIVGRVKKFVQIGTTCSYPKFVRPPFSEEVLWDGYPEETNAPYGLAKKMALVQLQAARQEFGFNGIYLIPTNLYGPSDEFAVHKSHVIPALINKCLEAKKHNVDHISVWGSGNATRDFLYVEDCAKAIMLATEKYDNGHPMNLGSGQEIRISSLVHLITKLTEFEGRIEWDTSKPDGQPRRALNTNHARHSIDWQAETSLRAGLIKTIEWYKEQEKVYA